MKKFLLGLVALFAFATPVVAQECTSLSDVVAILDKQGVKYVLVEAEKVQDFVDKIAEPILNQEIEGVTNVLIADMSGTMVFGLEVGGCVLGPVPVPGVSTLPAKKSGRMPDGSTHA